MNYSTEATMNDNAGKESPGPVFEDSSGTLFAIAGHMIPASTEYDLPGADDPLIFADILRSIGRDLPALEAALANIDMRAGGSLAALTEAERDVVIQAFRQEETALTAVLEAVTVRCYYRDDRVMASLGMEVRPPFPIGYEVKEGDWALLDPVRGRGPIYRDTGKEETS
jgi:hypothetical protein